MQNETKTVLSVWRRTTIDMIHFTSATHMMIHRLRRFPSGSHKEAMCRGSTYGAWSCLLRENGWLVHHATLQRAFGRVRAPVALAVEVELSGENVKADIK